MAEKKFLDYDGLRELVLKIKEYVGDAGKLELKGKVETVSALPTLSDQKVGWMYTVLQKGTTTSDFTDGAGKEVAALSEVAAVRETGTSTNSVWSINGGTSYVGSDLTAYVPTGTLGAATKLCSGYVAKDTDTDLVEGTLYVTNDEGTTFYSVTALAATFAGFTKVEITDETAKTALTGLIASFVNVNLYTETVETNTMKWLLIGPVFDVSDKLTFGTAMPSNPADGDTFLYLGNTTHEYVEANVNPTQNPVALGLYELSGSEYVLSSDTYAHVTLYKWYNGSEILYTQLEVPSVGTPVYKDNLSGSRYDLIGTVTEYSETEGIKASGAQEGFHSSTGTEEGKTYYEYAEQYVQGVIYKYNETEGWQSLNSGDTMIAITNAEIDILFE